VIRMLHNYIGNDAFRRGMNQYLKDHSYKNALTEDLWKSLSEASKKPVGEVMSTWTSQMGFPIITVEKTHLEGGKMTMVRPLLLFDL
jgi:puromycin-sensitive aminopeptidase